MSHSAVSRLAMPHSTMSRSMPLFRATLSLVALLSGASLAAADPTRGNLGGGFIEVLVTGGAPQYRQGAPIYNVPPQPTYIRPAPVRRSAGLVSTQRISTPHVIQQQAFAPTELEVDPMSQPVVPGRGVRQDRASAPLAPGFDQRFEKQEVPYNGPHGAGTVVVDTPNKFLYLVQGNGRALRYGIGVGRPGFEWAGMKTVSMKREWPDWRPPPEMLKRRPDLPRHMAGGIENPLGARALYLGSSMYRIHGTNEPETIGRAVSSGCIRMRNHDVEDLYNRVRVGTKVVVI